MKFTVLTLFPEILSGFFESSIMARAVKRGLVEYKLVNIRDYATDKHHKCDDEIYGGGAGMLMLAHPLSLSLEASGAVPRPVNEAGEIFQDGVPGGRPDDPARPLVIYVSPSGALFSQAHAARLSSLGRDIILVCGRYEGIDQRVIDLWVDQELSIGDYVLSSGEVAALAIVDAIYRLLPEVITGESLSEESHTGGLLEYPQYTRPEVYARLRVPEVLLSGHHANIEAWRLRKRLEKTMAQRPELLEKADLDAQSRRIVEELRLGMSAGHE